ncbi:MAG: DUF4019 domain-containing protein [Xanthomonadales bacterium]|nr:DUF4019 domain-containing protein [Xanthomonadales bacterium]NNK52356.1 DUF4019 domain-containing protein [Xanthomonadales bacterium]
MIRSFLMGSILLFAGALAHADSASIETAKIAATEWLAIADEYKYQETWSQASSLLQAEVSQSDWVGNIKNMREPLGKLEKRELSSSEFHESLPGAPDGQYFIFTFDSSFENNEYATEVIAVMKEDDSKWRVVGYYFA